MALAVDGQLLDDPRQLQINMGRVIPEAFVDELCESIRNIRTVFLVTAGMLGLMVLWFPFTQPGSATRVVVVMNIVGASGFVGVSGYALRRCLKREADRRERERRLDERRKRGDLEVGPGTADDREEDT